MGNAIRAGESSRVIWRRVAHDAAILGWHENVMREFEIGPASSDERGAQFRIRWQRRAGDACDRRDGKCLSNISLPPCSNEGRCLASTGASFVQGNLHAKLPN